MDKVKYFPLGARVPVFLFIQNIEQWIHIAP